jgi:CheY-like chemotaxis protein
VIVDLDMPGKGGLELIKEIRQAQGGVARELPMLPANFRSWWPARMPTASTFSRRAMPAPTGLS